MAYLTDEDFAYIFEKVPRLCVDVIIHDERGVLLSHRAHEPYKDMWHIPGGTVYKDELLSDAAIRIAHRELGVKVIPQRPLGVMEFFKENQDRLGIMAHSVSVGFEVLLESKEFNLSEDTTQVKFFTHAPEGTVQGQKDFLVQHKLLQG